MCTRAAPAAEFDHESVCQPGKKPKLVSALQTESSLTALSVEETDLPVHTTQQLGPGPGGSYYCANFETVLTTMLSSSPERHVINNEAVEAVERFMALPGKFNGTIYDGTKWLLVRQFARTQSGRRRLGSVTL